MNTAAASTRTPRSNAHHRMSHRAMAEMIAPVPLLEDMDDDADSTWDLGISSGHGQHSWEEDTAGSIGAFDD